MIAAAKFMINLFNFGMKFSYKYTGLNHSLQIRNRYLC